MKAEKIKRRATHLINDRRKILRSMLRLMVSVSPQPGRFGTKQPARLDSSNARNASEVSTGVWWATLGNNWRTAELGRNALLNNVECFLIGMSSFIWFSPSAASPVVWPSPSPAKSSVTKRTERFVVPPSSSDVVLFWSSDWKIRRNVREFWNLYTKKYKQKLTYFMAIL